MSHIGLLRINTTSIDAEIKQENVLKRYNEGELKAILALIVRIQE